MRLDRLWLTDFRNYRVAELEPAPRGLTVITGGNGHGKTNLLEAIGYLATLKSFRGARADALIRSGAGRTVVRAEAHREERALLIETELSLAGRERAQINRQPLGRTRDLLGALQVTVFTPEDLIVVKGGPQGRRDYLDDLLVALHPRHDVLLREVDRVLRQRNTLLKQAGGRMTAEVVATLDVWDAKLAVSGSAVVAARAQLVSTIEDGVSAAYDRVAERAAHVRLAYQCSWSGSLAEALTAARPDDLRRGLSTVGPHRDDLAASIGGLPSRTHASQGEQRSLALALRLAAHHEVSEALQSAPVLLLDDVFSELDPERSEALLGSLPPGQVLLTTAGPLPSPARPEVLVRIEDGKVLP